MDDDWIWMVLEMDKGSAGCVGFGSDGLVCGTEMSGVEGRLLQHGSRRIGGVHRQMNFLLRCFACCGDPMLRPCVCIEL